MAYEIPGFYLGVLPANTDLSDDDKYQYTAVKLVAASAGVGPAAAAITPITASGDGSAIGILQNNPIQNEAAGVMIGGVSKAKLGAVVAVGEKLQAVPNADGAGVFIPTASGKYAQAQALEAGVYGDIISVLLLQQGRVA